MLKILNSSFVRDFGSYGMIGVLGKAINILIIPIYVRLLSVQDFGALDIFSATLAILTLVSTFQLETSFLRFFYDLRTNLEKKLYFSSGLNTVAILLIPFVLASYFIVKPFFSEIDSRVLYLLLLVLPIQTIFAFVTCIYRVTFNRKVFVKINSINILGIPLLSLALVWLGYGVFGIVLATFIINLIALIATWPTIKEYYVLNINRNIVKLLFSYSLPLIPASVAIVIQQNASRFYILENLSVTAVGFYAFALKLFIPFSLIVQSLKMAWYPRAYKLFGNKNLKSFAKIEKFYTLLVLVLYFLIIFSADTIIQIVGGDKMIDSKALVPYFGIIFLLRALSFFYLVVPNIKKETKSILYINIISLFLFGIILMFIHYTKNPQIKWVLIGEGITELLKLFMIIIYSSRLLSKGFNYWIPFILVILANLITLIFIL